MSGKYLLDTNIIIALFGNDYSVKKNIARAEEVYIPAYDAETSKKYGYVKHILQKKGQPIPENDIWIAAIALQFDLCLISRDGHFLHIDNLQKASW